MKSKKQASLELVKLCCRLLDDKKAEDVRVLDVSEQSSITDFLIIATGTSEVHLRALRVELEKVIDASQNGIVGIETASESGWTVIDAFDVMIHLFRADQRAQYGLEKLWNDATEVASKKLLTTPKPKAPKKRPAAAKKTPVRKSAPKKRAK
jgi:ribosome-associated protein